jgi:hypothetical protein
MYTLKPPCELKNNGAHFTENNISGVLLGSESLKLFGYKVTRGGYFQLKYNNFVLPIA